MDANSQGALEAILMKGSLRTHEHERIFTLLRQKRKTKCLELIQELYACSEAEALIVYEAMKPVAVGGPVEMVEIALGDVQPTKFGFFAHYFASKKYFARTGSQIGTLTLTPGGAYLLNQYEISAKKIDQVWEVVPKNES